MQHDRSIHELYRHGIAAVNEISALAAHLEVAGARVSAQRVRELRAQLRSEFLELETTKHPAVTGP